MNSDELRLDLPLEDPAGVDRWPAAVHRSREKKDRRADLLRRRRGSALSALLKVPAFRQYSATMDGDLTLMSRQRIVEILKSTLLSAGHSNFETDMYTGSRRYFSHDLPTSSGTGNPGDTLGNDVIKHPLACGGRVLYWYRFRMPTFAEFLASSVDSARRNRDALSVEGQRSSLQVKQGQSLEKEDSGGSVVDHNFTSSFRKIGTSLIGKEARNVDPEPEVDSNADRQGADKASQSLSGVASSSNDSRLQPLGEELRENEDYDHTIWDFLSAAPEADDVDDEDGTRAASRSPNEPDFRSVEHAQAVREIVETEISYGNDLAVIKHEFYDVLKGNSLLSEEQLQAAFLNLHELIAVSSYFTKRLLAMTGIDQLPESTHYAWLAEARVGRAFLESTHMLLAFETYCVNQCTAVILVDQLTQERDVLRVFLDQLQKERPALRKMDLKSFLVVPVQRVTKYPLLLDRLLKLTPSDHVDREDLLQARRYVEETLSVINAVSE